MFGRRLGLPTLRYISSIQGIIHVLEIQREESTRKEFDRADSWNDTLTQPIIAMEEFASDTDSDYASYWRDWVSLSCLCLRLLQE